MRHSYFVVLGLIGLAAGDAAGEVIDAEPGGFSLVQEVLVDAGRADVWRAAVMQVGQWWSSDHTISGDARNMSIDAVPQGCFCESIGEHAGVVHLTVTFVNPQVMLRMTGGYRPGGLDVVAGPVDSVIGDALMRLKSYVETGAPENAG